MKDGQFDLRQLVKRIPEVNAQEHNGKAGCYLWVYSNIEENKLKLILHDETITDAVYAGQSEDMYPRRGRHERFLSGRLQSRSNHYRVGKGASDRAMIPLLLINNHNDDVKYIIGAIGLARFLDVLELTLVCLFRSWYPILIHDDPAHPLKRELAAGSLREIQYAKILNGIMVKVRARTGWAPQGTIGLNWLTPVFSQFNSDRTIMYWYSNEHKAYIFRTRRPMGASETLHGGPMVNITDKLRMSIPIDVFREGKLSNGQEVHIQFKIGYDQETQRYTTAVAPYVRLPAVTANNEFLKLRCLSVQIQWVDPETGVWKAAQIQRAKMLEMDKDSGELAAVTWGMRLWILLTRTNYINAMVGIPAWIPEVSGVGRFDVKEVFYDHLRQEYGVRPARTQTVIWPPHLSDSDKLVKQECLVQHLSEIYFNPKIAIGKKPLDLPKTRVNCDCCVSLNDVSCHVLIVKRIILRHILKTDRSMQAYWRRLPVRDLQEIGPGTVHMELRPSQPHIGGGLVEDHGQTGRPRGPDLCFKVRRSAY